MARDAVLYSACGDTTVATNARVAALAAGAFATGAPPKNPQRCFWLLAAAPRHIGLIRRIYRPYWEDPETTCGSEFVDDSDDGVRLPNLEVPSDVEEVNLRDYLWLNTDLTEYRDDTATVWWRDDQKNKRFWYRQEHAALARIATAVARRLLRAAPEAVPSLVLYPTSAPSSVLRTALATRALRLDFFRTTQGLAVTLLRRACAAWAHSLREVRVDVGTAVPWSISKSIFTALFQCPQLEVLCVPDIFVHIYDRDSPAGNLKPPLYFSTLRHLELHNGPQSRISWFVISRALLALQTLVLREHRLAPLPEQDTLLMLAAKANARATATEGAAETEGASNSEGAAAFDFIGASISAWSSSAKADVAVTTSAVSAAAPVAAQVTPPSPHRWSSAAASHRLPPSALQPPDGYDWHRGFSRLLKRRGLRQLHVRQEGMPREMERGLNMFAVRALHARRRGRSSGSDSESCGSTGYWDYEFGRGGPLVDTDADDDDAALAATRRRAVAVVRAARALAPGPEPPPRAVSRSRRRPGGAARGLFGLILLEVFNLYGGRRRSAVSRDVEPFVRYLAHCAPHLREVGLFCTADSAVLALRRAISTKLSGIDLRYVSGLDDVTLATLLRSRTGRRLQSLSVVHTGYSAVLQDPWVYGALGCRSPSTSDADQGDAAAGDATREVAGDATRELTGGASGLRLRRAHISVGEEGSRPRMPDVTALWMLDPRAVLGPCGAPRPF
jgi:hypothetical protein